MASEKIVKFVEEIKTLTVLELAGAVIGAGARLEYVVADRDATIRDTRMLVGYKTYPLFIEKKSVI